MTHRIYQYISYILIFFSGLSYASADSTTVFFDKNFTLSVSETVQVEGGLGFIKFIKVMKDSRCPVNVTCVWAGNVKVELEILDNDRKKTGIFLNSSVIPKKISLQRYTLQLISIFPAKKETVSISPEQYRVTFRIQARE